MKKTARVIRKIDVVEFETSLQSALDEGYELQSSSAFAVDNYAIYVAVLIK